MTVAGTKTRGRTSGGAGVGGLVRGSLFLLALGAHLDRRRLARATTLVLAGYVAVPFSALALAAFTNDALRHTSGGQVVPSRPGAAATMAVVVAVLLIAQLMCGHFAHLDYFELSEMQQSHLEGELMGMVNLPPTIDHLDNPAFADDLQLVREGLFKSTKSLEACINMSGLLLQTVLTAVILIRLNPWLALLPVMALPPVWAGNRAQAVLERAREQAAEALRLNRHLVELSTSAASVKELRLFGTEGDVLERQEAAWDKVTSVMWRGQARSAALRAGGQAFFALAYGGAVLAVLYQAGRGHSNLGDLVLVITLAVQVSSQVSAALSLLATLQAAGHTVERLTSLGRTFPRKSGDQGEPGQARRARPRSSPPRVAAGPPPRLQQGIVLEEVSFTYPGGSAPVLDRVSLELPAGGVVALVGENGAGKSTLVKLLCGMYVPTAGRILVDGVDLNELGPELWRAKVGALFQDFYRIELTLRESTGLGSVQEVGNDERVRRALAEAKAEAVLGRLPAGLDGYIGRKYGDGMDLSGGQWQTVALSRCLMREDPLLLVLDEPAAALDASAEHALFERYAHEAERAGSRLGSVTVLISHRFSTVLMASSIAVLKNGRLVEHGPHRQLMAERGLYCELFSLQRRAYAG